MKHWIVKSEPDVYGIDNLKKDKTTQWDGVRNYQARNFLRDEFKVGDLVIFYHSNSEPPGVAGVAEVVKIGLADQLQFNKNSEYYEPRASTEEPVWYAPKIRFREKFRNFVPIDQLREREDLKDLMLLRRGNRLSVMPISKKAFEIILKLGN